MAEKAVASRYLALALFVFGVTGTGLAIGYLTTPGAWYAGLARPWFTPPGWLFGPVWTILYVLIAIAGWRAFTFDAGHSSTAWWCGQMALNFFWSPVFFRMHQMVLALAVILLLLVAIAGFLQATKDRLARLLFLPYAAWVAFAGLLNGAIVRLN